MSLVEFATEGEIAIVTINRPEARNAVDRPTAAALAESFRRFDADDALAVAILTGAGGTFCAGADLKAVATDRGNRVGADGDGPLGCTRMLLTKPVIAAVEGFAVAGGIELALWCDLRVAARNATFGVYCRRFGVPLMDLGTVRLPRLIGHSRAMDLILTGRAVDAQEAWVIGLANRVVPKGEARQRAEELAAELAELPQQCMRSDRLSMLNQWGASEAEAMDFEFGSMSRVSAESLAGAQRFAGGAGRHGASA
jgi:enoyl-CoA hydratase